MSGTAVRTRTRTRRNTGPVTEQPETQHETAIVTDTEAETGQTADTSAAAAEETASAAAPAGTADTGDTAGTEQTSTSPAESDPQPETSEPDSAAAVPAAGGTLKQIVSGRLIVLTADKLDVLAEGLNRDAVRAYLANQLSYYAGVQQGKTPWDDRLGPITPLSAGKK